MDGKILKIKQTVRPGDFSDVGNAEVFERIYGDLALWTRGGGYFGWTGTRWEQSDQRAVSLARELTGQMLDDALREFAAAQKRASFDDAGECESKALATAKSYLAHANASRRKPRIDAMLGLAQAGLVRDLASLDPSPFDLNTPAGIVDLRTGAMRPHDPAALCTKITAAAPGEMGAEMWGELLKTVTTSDNELSAFLQQVAGMALIGAVYHEGIILAYGGGRNGKSTFFNALAAVLGDYCGHMSVSILTTERMNRGAALATLRGRRLVLTGELEEHQRLSVATLKSLASTDTVTGEEKYRAPEDFQPSHTICLFTNHLPRVGSTDGGTWRRLTVVPFNATISKSDDVPNYAASLIKKAGPAILRWAIDGAVSFCANGFKLTVPECVQVATNEYRQRENWIENFISDQCVAGDRVAGGELYAAYRAWSECSGEYTRRQNDFVQAMQAAGYRRITSNGRSYWIGLNLDNPLNFGDYRTGKIYR